MAEIGGDLREVDRIEQEVISPTVQNALPTIVSPNSTTKPYQSESLSAVIRRPPELQFGPGLDTKTAHFEDILLSALDPVSARTTGDLAYDVAELLIRRETEIRSSEDTSGLPGLEDLEETVRMYAHLAAMQAGN